MQQTMTFEMNDIQLIDKIRLSLFQKIRIKAFASGENAHTLPVDEEVLRQGAKTVYDAPIVWKYNKDFDDAMGHEADEYPCGFVKESKDNPVRFERAEDGRLFLVIDALIWTKYCGRLLDIFKKNDNKKCVSIEIILLDDADKDENNFGEKRPQIKAFAIAGITILGEYHIPAVEGCQAEVLAFSTDKNKFLTQKFDMTTEQKKDIFTAFMSRYTYGNENTQRYWMFDFDDNYVYAYDNQTDCQCRIGYHLDASQVKIDFEKVEQVKAEYVPISNSNQNIEKEETAVNEENKVDFEQTETTPEEEMAKDCEMEEKPEEQPEDKPEEEEMAKDCEMEEKPEDAPADEPKEEKMEEEKPAEEQSEETPEEEKMEEEVAKDEESFADDKATEDDTKEDDDKEEEKEDDKEEKEDFELKFSQLQSTYNELVVKFDELSTKLNAMSDYDDLKSFKAQTEAQQLKEVEMAKMSKVMSDIENRGINITEEEKQEFMSQIANFENIDAWSNFVKSQIFDRVENIDGIVRIGMPYANQNQNTDDDGIWARLGIK